MNLTRATRLRRRVVAIAAAVSATILFSATAAFAANDDFSAATTDGCGVANFIDYGPGAAGGGNNDDYVVIHDYCSDGHGVRAYVWIQGEYWGDQYNGNGLAGSAVVWDPFRLWGGSANLTAGTDVRIEVCLVDGSNDGVNDPSQGSKCRSASHQMIDG
jgi:hypothetical protein